MKFGPLRNGCGWWMIARLGPDADFIGSPVGTVRPPWWDAMRADPKTDEKWVSNNMVQGHLLNRLLGGPADMRNLTPITKRANSEHHRDVEKAAKAIRGRRKHMHYKVKVDYSSAPPATAFDGRIPERYLVNFPLMIVCTLREIDTTTGDEYDGTRGTKLDKTQKNYRKEELKKAQVKNKI